MKDAENPETTKPKPGKGACRPHNVWASQDAKLVELEAENKKLKQKLKELKGSSSGEAVSVNIPESFHSRN